MILKLLIGYWLILNALQVIGGVIAWWDLHRSKHRVVVYQSRLLLALAIRAIGTIWGVPMFSSGLESKPIYTFIQSVVISTLVTGAIWGWLLYARGVINGSGIMSIFTRGRK